MGILTKTTAADLRQRAEAAAQAAAEADRRANAARAEAAGFLADGNDEGANRARNRTIELATEAETQRDLAAELHRRADEAAKAERLAAYTRMRSDAEKASAHAESLIRSLLDEMGPRILAAQEAQQAASAKCHAVTMLFFDMPEELGAAPPPSAFDPMLTDGFTSTRVRALHVWRIA
jgi:colicin import membrane protein/SWI/SNF-related matrix-associated actin-dependent regulator 1 of chromatin subfamily A